MRRPSYFRKWLPALFERTLVMDDLDLNGGHLSWIFTGQRGGLTILLHEEHLEIVERFYDTPAYLQMESDSPGSTSHPQWVASRRAYPYTGKPESVTVRRDHRLGLMVLLNGQSPPGIVDKSRTHSRQMSSFFCRLRTSGASLVLTARLASSEDSSRRMG